MITLRELIHGASRHGIHLRPRLVHDAVDAGELVAMGRDPLLFDEDEANRWLTLLMRGKAQLPGARR